MQKSSNENILGIVIPAYKGDFLRKSLSAIASQTDIRFRLYIGDDASPEPLEKIVREFNSFFENRLIYCRFPENLGSISLVRHWQRCIGLCSEPWIWLFSDDDVMDTNCVSSFYQAVEQTGGAFDVYRFDTLIINENDKIIEVNPPHPMLEDWKSFLYYRLRGLRFASQQDYIFSRATFEQMGGFVDFPLAWCSDTASLIAFASEKGIYRISGAKVRFRLSGQNISSINNRAKDFQKILAAKLYSEWVLQRIRTSQNEQFPIDDDIMRDIVKQSLITHLIALHAWLGPKEFILLNRFFHEYYGEPIWRSTSRLLKLNLNLVPHKIRALVKL